MPVFRFNKAFGIARDLKVFLNVQSGLTRGAVPDIEQHKRQANKLRVARQKARQIIKEQRKALKEQTRALSYAQRRINENKKKRSEARQIIKEQRKTLESKQQEIFQLKNKDLRNARGRIHEQGKTLRNKDREIFQLKNELRAAEERVESATKGRPTPRRCIVSLATDDGHYPASLDRLERSLEQVGFAGEFMCWRPGKFPDGSPAHADVPFAFKPYCLAEARRRGGVLLLWLDASCVAVRPLEPIFQQIERDGYILFRNHRNRVGEWASDEALGVLDLSRDQAMEIPEVNAAVIGLNTSNPVANSFLEKWLRAAQEGVVFRGVSEQLRTEDDYKDVKWNRGGRVSSDPRVRGHRHDQMVAGVLAAQLGMRLSSEGLQPSRDMRSIRPKTRIVKDRNAPSHEAVFDDCASNPKREAARKGGGSPSLAAGKPRMRFLTNDRLYHRTEECLQWLSQIPVESPAAASDGRERCHLYWHGSFSLKQAFAVKSFLATQDLDRTELWLWLDGERGYDGYEDNPLLRPLLPYVQVKRFDAQVEATDTPVERSPQLYKGVSPTQRSNLFRHVVLFKYGGIYADMDTMFLRDLRDLRNLPPDADEFCYRWSAHMPYANSAFMRLRQESYTARALLVRCAEKGSCQPQAVLRFDDSVDLDILVLPSVCFDPLWLHHDHRDRYHATPFHQFGDFFRKFKPEFLRNADIWSYRNFFPDAFAYHWHNFWDASEHADSYFGLFNQEFDTILKYRLGIESPA